ncbi:MAG: sulfatase [Bacteroidales bacterium]|jgi:arylsulfatase A-like enzyme
MHPNKILLIFAAGLVSAQSEANTKPNFVWFMTEDVSADYLSLYNALGQGASTPNVRKLAQEGVIFNNAFSNAPVSSPARSTLFSGCYANKLGVGLHRKYQAVDLPATLKMFPAYLREAGYYTTNSDKKDYNYRETTGTWDNGAAAEDAWRTRPVATQPFFHVLTTMLSHEGTMHFSSSAMTEIPTRYNPDSVVVAPNHPNTSLFRYSYASFFDKIDDADAKLGQLIDRLKVDGVLDDTFIFYFGDNGGTLPGTKGYVTEMGLHVPLVVYVPLNWRDSINLPVNSRVSGFVSFIDFAPTLLRMAGIDPPAMMDGQAFLGKQVNAQELENRNESYGYGDRFDELYAFTRTLRKGNYNYIRNFQPYHPEGLFVNYRYKMAAFNEWKSMYDQGILNDVQRRFFEPQQPEELYDISVDPYETNNLATQPAYAGKLLELRNQLSAKMITLNDIGMYPESEWIEKAGSAPYVYSFQHALNIQKYITVANLMFLPFSDARPAIELALQSDDPVEKYWGLTVCSYFGEEAVSLKDLAVPLLSHPSVYVAGRAIVFLSLLQEVNTTTSVYNLLKKANTNPRKVQLLNDAAFLKDKFGYVFDFTGISTGTNGDVVNRVKYLTTPELTTVDNSKSVNMKLWVNDNQLFIHQQCPGKATIQVFDTKGVMLMSDEFSNLEYSKKLTFKGLLIVAVKNETSQSVFKVVI